MLEIHDPNERRIGPYTVVGTLARGATSEVVRAMDSDLNRTVAIKLLSKDFVKEPEALARFERESRALTVLKHPNIARIYESAISPDGQPYFVMEFVDGRSLMDLIRDKIEFPLSQQIDMIIQAAEGLNAALNQQIIHRDIKPANLMLDHEFRVKVVDFGLAKVISEDAYKSVAGVVMGTPRYMAPEVALGRTADYRSDIYSLGGTFYHLVTGQPPFDGDTPAAVMMQHVNSPLTPPYLINPQIPADVCEIIEKAMAKDVNHRYQDYVELISDLKEAKMARLAREQGQSGGEPVQEESVREVGAGLAAPQTAGAPGSSLSGPTEPAARPSYRTEGKVLVRSEVGATPSTSGSRTLILLAGLLVLALGGLIFVTVSGGPNQEGRSGLSSLLGAVLSRFGKGGESPEEAYYRQYKETLERVKFLVDAVREYVGAVGEVPSSLDDLVDRKIVKQDELHDGFGGRIIYEPPTRSLRAPGPDGVLNTLDDFLTDATGRLIQYPTKPEKLSMEEFITITGN